MQSIVCIILIQVFEQHAADDTGKPLWLLNCHMNSYICHTVKPVSFECLDADAVWNLEKLTLVVCDKTNHLLSQATDASCKSLCWLKLIKKRLHESSELNIFSRHTSYTATIGL